MTYILVFLGGGLGSLLRYALTVFAGAYFPRLAAPLHEAGFPWTTLCINVLGSCTIGVVVQLASQSAASPADSHLSIIPPIVSPEARLFLAVGVCGGFTTFSTFSLEALTLLQAGRMLASGVYVLASASACVVGVASGVALAAWWMKWRGFGAGW